MKILFRHAYVVTMDDQRRMLADTDVLVEDGRIAQIGAIAADFAADRVIDARGKVLMPGLINCHSHIGMSIFRNYGNDQPLMTWLEDYIWPLEAHLTRDDIYEATRLNVLEMLRSGTTALVDMYYEMDRVAEACEELGIRALLTRGLTSPVEGARLNEQRELFDQWHGRADGRIRVMIGTHAIYTNTEEDMKRQVELSKELGCGFHIHISETEGEVKNCLAQYGRTPVQVFDDLGMLDERTIAAHCVYLSDEDIAILAKRRVNVCYNPASNMKLASGFLPLQRLLDAGVNVCFGTDGSSSNNMQDVWRDLFLGSMIQKGIDRNAQSAPAMTMLELATRNGAKALGLSDEIGSVEVGKKADLILVDFDNIHHTPFPDDVAAALIYSTLSTDVAMTMVNGEILMENGRFDRADVAVVRADVNRRWGELKARGDR